VAAEVDDRGCRRAGLHPSSRGHGRRPPVSPRAVRAASREFFTQPEDVKQRYKRFRSEVTAGSGRAPRANAYAEGTESPPGPKGELQASAPRRRPAIPTSTESGSRPNVWPTEVPSLQQLVDEYTAAMRRVFR